MRRIRIGLALGSGIARGWAHLGVLKALDKLGIVPDIIAGTSIGALVGGFYLGGHADKLEQWARRLTKFRMLRYFNLSLGGGMISGDKLFQEAENYIGDTAIDELAAPFVAVATDLRTGHEVWLREGRVVDAMRASLSLPGVFKPVYADGRWLLDGALVNPVPVSVCRALGARMVIAVNLSADIMGKGRASNGDGRTGAIEPDVRERSKKQPKQANGEEKRAEPPGTFDVMVESLNIVQDRIARGRLAGDPPDVSIAPRIGHIGLLDFHRADELITEGVDAVERAMPEIRDAIAVFGAMRA